MWLIYFRARLLSARGQNIIFDRYALFHVIKRNYSGDLNPLHARLAEELFIIRFPRPDVFIYFDIMPERALERKQEDPLLRLEQKYTAYDNLLERYRLGMKVIRVNASLPLEGIIAQVVGEIWKDLVRQ